MTFAIESLHIITRLALLFNKLNISKHVAPTGICMAIPSTACKQITLQESLSTLAKEAIAQEAKDEHSMQVPSGPYPPSGAHQGGEGYRGS